MKLKSLTLLLLATSIEAFATCRPPEVLPYQNNWLGGDVGTSLTLPNGKLFWIFGDSFIGNENKIHTRLDSHFINNSIAISECQNKDFKIDYHWENKNNSHASFFKAQRPNEFYWPMSSFFTDGAIFVNLLRLKYDKESFVGFSEEGVDIVRIKNWQDPIEEWKKEYISLSERRDVFPSAESVIEGEYVYFFSHRQGGYGLQENALGRISRIDLITQSDLRDKITYLNNQNKFEAYGSDTKAVIKDGNTEFSVKKIGDQWTLVQMKRNRALMVNAPDQITISKSSSLAGPWSDNKIIFEVPETSPNDPLYNEFNFCYAAKIHDDLSLSYVCNTTNPLLIWERMDIYTPKFIFDIKL